MNRRRINKLVGAFLGIGLLMLFRIDFAWAQGQPGCSISSNAQVRWVQYEGGFRPVIENQTFENGEALTIRDCLDFRVTNNTFRNITNKHGVSVEGLSRGVIDNNSFSDVHFYPVTVTSNGNTNWDSYPRFSAGLGMEAGLPKDGNAQGKYETADAVYVENNTFNRGDWVGSIESNNGSRYVFRFNRVENVVGVEAGGAHGFSSWERGSRSWEIYGNYIQAAQPTWNGFGISGGDGVFWGNNFSGSPFTNPIHLFDPGGKSSQDGNCNDFPCKDQIREAYIWDNQLDGNDIDQSQLVVVRDSDQDIIRPGQEYFLEPKQDYTPFCYPHPLVSGVDCDPGNIDPPENRPPRKPTLQINRPMMTLFSSIPYFGDANNWEPNQSNEWEVQFKDGDWRYVITATNFPYLQGKLPVYSLVKDRIYTDFTMTLKAKAPNFGNGSHTSVNVIFGYQDDNNYYYMMFNTNSEWSALHKVENGVRSDITVLNQALVTDNNYHDIEISRQGSQIKVKRDGQTVLTAQDSTFSLGQVGVGAFSDPVYFDDEEVVNP